MRPVIAITCQRRDPGMVFPREAAMVVISDYCNAIWRAGGMPAPVFPEEKNADARCEDILDASTGVVIVGGPDVDPSRYGQQRREPHYPSDPDQEDLECALISAALRDSVPMLAICRGAQLLNVVCGGTLHQHLPDLPWSAAHGVPNGGGATVTEVIITPGSLAGAVFSAERVIGNCHHHQAIDQLGTALRITGSAKDGCPEVIEHLNVPFALGVQWHPEETAANNLENQRLFDALVTKAKERSAERSRR